jgi:hypothetical protein
MRNARHFYDLLDRNPNAGVGFTLAAAAVYAARHGFCETEHHATDEFHDIAVDLRTRYGDTLTTDEVRREMKLAAAPALAENASRTFMLRVRLTEAERDRLQAMADRETGGDMSAVVRLRLFG